MTHASWNNERGRPSGPGHDNERLEYLGDAVLELVVGEYLFKRFPQYDEGQLTQLRAALVNTVTLARLAERLELGEALFVGKGAAKTGARQLPSLLANSFEALIGAIFLDQGYRVATRVFLQNIGDLADWTDENFKGKLQEVAQDRTGTTPIYRVAAGGGPGHKREYTADAVVGGEVVGTGRGGTKQAAEQAAARAALETLSKQPKRRVGSRATAARAGGAARQAARSTAGEPPRGRRRVAEVPADRSMADRQLERAHRDALPPLFAEQPPAEGPQRRRRGLLGAIRSAAEALVGRVGVPEPTAAPPAPEVAEVDAGPQDQVGGRAQTPRAGGPARRGGRGGGPAQRGGSTAGASGGASPASPGGQGARPRGGEGSARRGSGRGPARPPRQGQAARGGQPDASSAAGAPGYAERDAAHGIGDRQDGAASAPTGTGGRSQPGTAGRRPRAGANAPRRGSVRPDVAVADQSQPAADASAQPDAATEPRRPSRRGRRGGRGRRRPGSTAAPTDTPTP